MVGEQKETNFLWKFADSPFAWGGVGVVAGAALDSPSSFNFAFIGGGIAVAIGLLRAQACKGKALWLQIIVNVILLSFLYSGWYLLWRVIPKPTEPPTPDAIATAVERKLGTKGNPNQNAERIEPHKPASVNQIADAVVAKLPKQTEIPDDLLRAMATNTAQRMRNAWTAFDLADARLEAQRPRFQGDKKQNVIAARQQLRLNLLDNNEQLLSEADYIRQEILVKIGNADYKAQDWVQSGLGQFTNAGRLEKLAKELPQ